MTSLTLTLQPATRVETRSGRRLLARLLFWSWNAVFLTFVFGGMVPQIASDFLRDIARGRLPWDLALTFLLAMLVPLAASIAGLLFRRDAAALMRIFYGLEMPLFFLLLWRMFLVRQVALPIALLACCLAAGWTAFALDIGVKSAKSRIVAGLRAAALTALAAVTLYVGLLLTLYIVPIVSKAVVALLSFQWAGELGRAFSRSPSSMMFVGLGLILFAYSATIFFALPAMTSWMYGHALGRALKRFSQLTSRAAAIAISVTTLALLGLAFAASNQQPQQEALALLAAPPESDQERLERLDEASDLHEGLLNAYLASYRYYGAKGGRREIQSLYARAFGGDWEDYQLLRSVHDGLASPWLYDGERLGGDTRDASKLYQEFFDTPLQKGAQQQVMAALNATWDRSGIEAGLLDRDRERVLLVQQALTVEERGDMATIELHEVYENQTPDQQEILYHFALPQSAAITGLWLGDTDDRDQAFRFSVAPRGAAQKVYQREVRRRVDPALLEQIGPQQYRLRVFPIPGRSFDEATPRMHLWMTFEVLAQENSWPMPRLLERRNIFWNDETLRTARGEPLPPPGDGWLWPTLDAQGPARPREHMVLLEGGFLVRATPSALPLQQQVPHDQRLAVVLDRSYSMNEQAQAVGLAVAWLRERVAPYNHVDLFLTASPVRGEPPISMPLEHFDEQQMIFYGGQATSSLLQQYRNLAADNAYDAVFLLTDDGGLDLEPDTAPDMGPAPDEAVWLVHLGGELPTGYDDGTLAAIQKSGGGIAFSLEEAFTGYLQADAAQMERWADGYLWSIESDVHAWYPNNWHAPAEESPFSRLAARHLVEGLQAAGRADDLDSLHAAATHYEVVTPFSSMIVLVNDRQREALRKASEQADRFQRLTETGKEALSGPFGGDLLVSGVPEPHEWALIGLALALMAGYILRSRRPARCGATPGLSSSVP